MIKIPHEHIRQKFPIVYTFYGHYDIDRTTEGPSLSYNYVILTPSPGVEDPPHANLCQSKKEWCEGEG